MSLIRAILCALALMCAVPAAAQTFGSCTIATSSIPLGSVSSYTVGTAVQQGSGSSGLQCSALSVATSSYLKLRIESSTFLLTGGAASQTIPFIISAAAGGPALAAGTEFDFSSFSLLSLFSGPGASVPIYVRTTATAGLQAGTYTGTVNARWYFSICTLGVGLCLATSRSAGFSAGPPIVWGIGVPVTLNVTLTVQNDCLITAPNLDFGTAPLANSFMSATRTISIRCTAGSAYTVGLSDGVNAAVTGARRMRRGATADYLLYDLYKGASGTSRWGVTGAERRSSGTADTNPGIYDSTSLQGFAYRGVIDPAQATPGAGSYVDTITVDVAF